MAKITPISGYPEWLPEQKRFEQQLIHIIQQQASLQGFLPIETRAVEPLSVLLSKGDDKEIYVIKRLHAHADDPDKLGLHFDLTVPFARYVEEFQSQLVFPFKRCQIQKVWRGERKQEGRYREFVQCDLDIVAQNQLPLHYDAEMAYVLMQLLHRLPIPPVVLKLSHRKILQGFYLGLGIECVAETLRCVDKLSKIGADGVLRELTQTLGLSGHQAEKALALGEVQTEDSRFVALVTELGVSHPILTEGLQALAEVMDTLRALGVRGVAVDLSIARGLDYYTGTVYEGYLTEHRHIGAICSGGRYDRLIGAGAKAFPGVGVSLGLTRLLGYGFDHDLFDLALSPALSVWIILPDESMRVLALQVAEQLRIRGIRADVHHAAQSFGKQIRHAERRGVSYVWFIEQGMQGSVKHLKSGEQVSADAYTWEPAA